MTSVKHFLDLDRLDKEILRGILDKAVDYKRRASDAGGPLEGKILAMIFEKPSTRTRVSFDVAMRQLGGQTLLMNERESQLGRGETVADTARVLSRYVDAIMIRTDSVEKLAELAEHADVPVINGLTDRSHPCQLMADVMTFEEHKGPIQGKSVAWVGDGNNVASTWIHAAAQFDFELRLACPAELPPDPGAVDWARGKGAAVTLTDDPADAVDRVDCVVTDVWISMGDKDATQRHNLLRPYQVDEAMMGRAHSDAIFMHCLPAHRGEEISAAVLESERAIVFDQAENRLHAQKAILEALLQT